MSSPYLTTVEMSERLRCSTWLVKKLARDKGIGLRLPGRAGWRFTTADEDRLREVLAPAPPVATRRRKRRSA